VSDVKTGLIGSRAHPVLEEEKYGHCARAECQGAPELQSVTDWMYKVELSNSIDILH